jgi:formylglycine-generating enzyme required for sulfatase activity
MHSPSGSFSSRLIACIILVLGHAVLQAAPAVSNLSASQREGTRLVDLSYDLAAPGMSSVPIRLEVSSDGGTTWTVPVNTVSGDLGTSVNPGTGKTMVWNAGADWPNGYSTLMRFRVTADDGFAFIPAGSFTMGRTSGDTDTNAPPVTVTISGFYLQKTETTKSQWDETRAWGALNGYSDFTAGAGKAANHPIRGGITWWNAVKWCNARSEQEGLTPCYLVEGVVMRSGTVAPTCEWTANGYRLPTEAEWEKAARGGITGKRFSWGGDTISHDNANYVANSALWSYDLSGYTVNTRHPLYSTGSPPYTSPVASFSPNAYGLYDMTGNAEEWCWDWYGGNYYTNAAIDPRGPATGNNRVMRGGAEGIPSIYARSSNRTTNPPATASSGAGFRPAKSHSNTMIEASAPALDTRGPDISAQSQTVAPDAPVSFTVVAAGTGTLTYQWQKDGVDIPGATSSTFGLTNAKPWHIGDYTVRVTDSSGEVTSNIATLTVSGVNSNLWKGLIGFYNFSGDSQDRTLLANDFINTNAAPIPDRQGIANSAYSFDGISAWMISERNLPISGASPRTFAFWMRRANRGSLPGNPTIIGHGTKNGTGDFYNVTQNQGDKNLLLHGSWMSADTNRTEVIPEDQWIHVVVSSNGTVESTQFYFNGIAAPQTFFGSGNFATVGTKLRISTSSDSGGISNDGFIWWNAGFKGGIDDVKVFNRAFNAVDISALYSGEATVQISSPPQSLSVIQNQPASLSVTAAGIGSVTYVWEKDGVVIPGATSTTLAFQAVKPWNVGSYRVRITDNVGTVVSAAAQLTLNTAQPASLWQDLLLFLPFAGNTTDLSPSARTVTQSYVTTNVSPLGTVAGSASFNGTSSRMDFSPNLPDLTEMTISSWIRVRIPSGPGGRLFFSDWDGAKEVTSYIEGDDLLIFSNKGNGNLNSRIDGVFQDDVWKHVVWTMGSAISRIYVNGQLTGEISAKASNVGNKGISNIGYFAYSEGSHYLSGDLSCFRIYGRALTESEAVQLYQYDAPMPEIELEQPLGTALVDGSATTTWQALPTGGTAAAAPYVIRNVGVANLLNLGLTKTGTHAADFLLGSLSTTTLAPGESTTFTVAFSPGAGPSGARTASLQVASNDVDENPFDIALSGTAYSTTLDADSDGMNDWGEVKLSALGFDWQTPNTALVSTYYENAAAAGLFTTTQVQDLNVGIPLMQRNHATGEFTLTIGVDKSTNLSTWTPMPMTGPQLLINGQGKLEFRFNSPDNAAFFRLKSQSSP